MQSADPRIYTSLTHLQGLEGAARGLSLSPRQPSGSVLNGHHASRLRGRGLNFEEIRDYRRGDDVRSIDWKVTARTGEPHVRVYTEEKDRQTLVVVDQRMSMYFGSVLNMKSVTAAEAAALTAFAVLKGGDRVGGLVFDDRRIAQFRPQRSRRAVHALLQRVSDYNCALHAEREAIREPMPLNRVLQETARLALHDTLVLIFSDFDGIDQRTDKLLSGMRRHNDLVLVLVHDPSARQFPRAARRQVLSDGERQIEVDLTRESLFETLARASRERLERIEAWQRELGIPVLPLSCGEPTLPQVRRLLGHAPRARRLR